MIALGVSISSLSNRRDRGRAQADPI